MSKRIKLSDIYPDEFNFNVHTQGGMELLKKSVEKVGTHAYQRIAVWWRCRRWKVDAWMYLGNVASSKVRRCDITYKATLYLVIHKTKML